jgi:hypothetical protein
MITISLPDQATINSSHTCILPIRCLPITARRAHIFPDPQSHSLLSIGQRWYHGCITIFTAITRSTATGGLWTIDPIPLASHPCPHSAITAIVGTINAFLNNETIINRIALYHVILFSPVISTWCAAIDAGHFITWPGLTSTAVHKYPPIHAAMYSCHMYHRRSNQRFTQHRDVPPADATQQQVRDETPDTMMPMLYVPWSPPVEHP